MQTAFPIPTNFPENFNGLILRKTTFVPKCGQFSKKISPKVLQPCPFGGDFPAASERVVKNKH
jgi:hypothetical protein